VFSEWLTREPAILKHRLVVVPTREAGRSLRERLIARTAKDGTGAMLGPRIATPDDFFRPESQMPDAVRWAGWLDVLRNTDDDQVRNLFPSGLGEKDDAWRLSVLQQIEQSRELLVSGSADFIRVSSELSEEADRWKELARLESRVVELWKTWGFDDPVNAKGQRAMNPVCPAGVEEIILAGVTDPTPLAVTAWNHLTLQGVRFKVLVGAPVEYRAAFDIWGRPDPGFWCDRRQHATPVPQVASVAADPVAMAKAVVAACEGKNNLELAVGVCDNTFSPAISRRFQEAGWATFEPESLLLAKDGWPELLGALAAALEMPEEHAAIARLARHPWVWMDWVKGGSPRAVLARLGKWEIEHAATSAADTIKRLLEEGTGNGEIESEAKVAWRETSRAAGNLLNQIYQFVTNAPVDGGPLENQLRVWLETHQPEAAQPALAEMEVWPDLAKAGFSLSIRLKWLATTLGSVPRISEVSEGVLALQGWIELAFDPAPHLVLAALHEGHVPEVPPAHPLITEAVREKLGLRNRASRLAREVFLYTAMLEGRRTSGSVTVITAQVDGKGEPAKPSRVLLHASRRQLPGRVLGWVKEYADIPLQPTPAWSRCGWQLRRPQGMPSNREWKQISPSLLKAYLACPTRFYFSRVLGWESFEAFNGELAPARFGDLIHAVLREWGQDPVAREWAEARQLESCWRQILSRQVTRQFGVRLPALIRLQILSAQERLAALAEKQAAHRLEGWQVIEVEFSLSGVLTLGGLPVEMKIDRIDRHHDGRMQVIDYKTGKTVLTPEKAHLRPWSKEKCPPALAALVPPIGRQKTAAWTDLQLPLYAAAVQKQWLLNSLPEACYVQLPEATGKTGFTPFKHLDLRIGSALDWAEAAARRIRDGVFWPPAPQVSYDDLARVAPEGLEKALGAEWKDFLGKNPVLKGVE